MFLGFFGSYRISTKKSVAMISAADMHVVGWPLPASDVERIESIRSRVAMLWSAGTEGSVMAEARVYHRRPASRTASR
jgi:hypothetical protein